MWRTLRGYGTPYKWWLRISFSSLVLSAEAGGGSTWYKAWWLDSQTPLNDLPQSQFQARDTKRHLSRTSVTCPHSCPVSTRFLTLSPLLIMISCLAAHICISFWLFKDLRRLWLSLAVPTLSLFYIALEVSPDPMGPIGSEGYRSRCNNQQTSKVQRLQ